MKLLTLKYSTDHIAQYLTQVFKSVFIEHSYDFQEKQTGYLLDPEHITEAWLIQAYP